MVKLGIYLVFTFGFLHPDALLVSSLTRLCQTGSPVSSARFLPAPHTTLATLTNVLLLEHAKHTPSLVTLHLLLLQSSGIFFTYILEWPNILLHLNLHQILPFLKNLPDDSI